MTGYELERLETEHDVLFNLNHARDWMIAQLERINGTFPDADLSADYKALIDRAKERSDEGHRRCIELEDMIHREMD